MQLSTVDVHWQQTREQLQLQDTALNGQPGPIVYAMHASAVLLVATPQGC